MSSAPGPFQAILFDLDGVLVDSYEVWFQLLNHAAAHWSYPAIPRETFHACWGQGVEADQARFFPNHQIPEIETFFHDHFMEHAAELVVANETEAIFAALRSHAVRTAVITNTPNPLASAVVQRAGVSPDTIIGANDVPNGKPAPDMVLEACTRLAVTPERSLVVGDSRYDAGAARAAGVSFAGIGGIEGDLTLGSLLDLLRYL